MGPERRPWGPPKKTWPRPARGSRIAAKELAVENASLKEEVATARVEKQRALQIAEELRRELAAVRAIHDVPDEDKESKGSGPPESSKQVSGCH